MITFQRITTADRELYAFLEELMTRSFPADEYRDLNELRDFTDHRPHFYNNVILNDGHPIGLISYWDFDDFYYAEHFAIDPTQRNGGYGKATLEHLCRLLDKPIVLEVEEPDEEMARRRIGFYQRNGFVLWDNEYRQPPYKPGDSYLPMRLMVYGPLDSRKDYNRVVRRIYRDVYKAE